jgi:hypothetical protein
MVIALQLDFLPGILKFLATKKPPQEIKATFKVTRQITQIARPWRAGFLDIKGL